MQPPFWATPVFSVQKAVAAWPDSIGGHFFSPVLCWTSTYSQIQTYVKSQHTYIKYDIDVNVYISVHNASYQYGLVQNMATACHSYWSQTQSNIVAITGDGSRLFTQKPWGNQPFQGTWNHFVMSNSSLWHVEPSMERSGRHFQPWKQCPAELGCYWLVAARFSLVNQLTNQGHQAQRTRQGAFLWGFLGAWIDGTSGSLEHRWCRGKTLLGILLSNCLRYEEIYLFYLWCWFK